MQLSRLACAALLGIALPVACAGCGAGATPASSSPAAEPAAEPPLESESAAPNTSLAPEPVTIDPLHGEPAPAPTPEFLRAVEDSSRRSEQLAAENAAALAKERAGEEAEAGRPVSSGTCVGPASKAAKKKVRSEASCCYIPPTYFIKRIQAKRDDFRACYNDALKRNPATRGRTTTKFVVEEDGSVAGVCDVGSTVADPAMVACVLKVFTTLTFDGYKVGDPCPAVTVSYPMRFSQEAN